MRASLVGMLLSAVGSSNFSEHSGLPRRILQPWVCVCPGLASVDPTGFHSQSESKPREGFFKGLQSFVVYLRSECYFSFSPTEQISPEARLYLFHSYTGKKKGGGQFSNLSKRYKDLRVRGVFMFSFLENLRKGKTKGSDIWNGEGNCSLNLVPT